ncbi:MAG: adenylosuccinate synthase [Candidatus Micrarchaeota archaeon]
MSVSVIIGTQWGDEGKGKIIDMFARDYDYIVRFNGGNNAGHTIKVGEAKFGLHLIPSAVFYPEKYKVIGNGVVIHPETLLKEIDEVEKAGYSLEKLRISERAHIILDWHLMLDGIEAAGKIGTTKRGIGPTYADKATRVTAIRIYDLYDGLKEKVNFIVKIKKQILNSYGQKVELDADKIYDKLETFAKRIKPYVCDTQVLLNDAIERHKSVMLEGAQGTMLDMDHGTYPFVTSSNIVSGSACTGSGIPPNKLTKVIGIVKAYTTRVGEGPFPTELNDKDGEMLRKNGNEFGTTTGRPRRCGWLDLVVVRYACRINGLTELVVTKMDVLDGFDEIKVCTEYEVNGKKTKDLPVDLAKAKPIYKTFKGWGKPDWKKEVPKLAKEYLEFIEKETGVKITVLSYGPKRDETRHLS